ncbi:hypothetical protein CJF31_00009442 [Rutstroemia sp. NJR-2017a BVV2]|nr:hypothetical protein CJF31_00009442 [Rutstroemia sp. NJR-2017a BVV2]
MLLPLSSIQLRLRESHRRNNRFLPFAVLTFHTHNTYFKMALKRINKELTDLGRDDDIYYEDIQGLS